MKKTICIIFLMSFLFTVCACSFNAPKQITVAEAGYSCDADVLYGENLSLNATVKAMGGGILSVTVNTPEDISGLCFSFDNNEMSVSYNNSLNSKNISTEYGGFAEVINEVFLKFTTGRPTVPFEDGAYVFKGNNTEFSFAVVFNEQGFPLSLTVPEENLTATFSNWKY